MQGMDAVTPGNEDLNIFRILTTHLLRLLTLPWSIVSLAEPLLNRGPRRPPHPPNNCCKWRLHKVLPRCKCPSQSGGSSFRPPNTFTSTSWGKMSCYATSKCLKGNPVAFSLHTLTLVEAQWSKNRILSDKQEAQPALLHSEGGHCFNTTAIKLVHLLHISCGLLFRVRHLMWTPINNLYLPRSKRMSRFCFLPQQGC